ncbi:hypothetical protein OF83DRAFT_1089835, partial [Amylostereum chailletii]
RCKALGARLNRQTFGSWPSGPYSNSYFTCPFPPVTQEFRSAAEFHQYWLKCFESDVWVRESGILPSLRDAIASALQGAGSSQPVLCHGDLPGRNILVRDGRVVALLDFEMFGWYPDFWNLMFLLYLSQDSGATIRSVWGGDQIRLVANYAVQPSGANGAKRWDIDRVPFFGQHREEYHASSSSTAFHILRHLGVTKYMAVAHLPVSSVYKEEVPFFHHQCFLCHRFAVSVDDFTHAVELSVTQGAST